MYYSKSEHRLSVHQNKPVSNGIVLPKTSNVARSNSLRSSSPPRLRRDHRNNANVPPAVPEEPVMPYPSLKRDPCLSKPQVRDRSPAERSLSNHEVPNNNPNLNGNMQEHHNQMPHNQYGSHAHSTHSHSTHSSSSSHHSSTNTGYPARPDQNQNVKKPPQVAPPVSHPPPPSSTSAAKQHHEQRLTHEQVRLKNNK